MRIVAGKFRGAQIEAPKGLATRPTSDRVRQALFNVLEHGAPRFDFDGARVLDLFAGSGALGLEALSRGARYCLFIEEDAGARAAIRRNVEALGLTGVTKIWRRDATKLGEAGALQSFQLIFCDPPYGKELGERALAEAVNRGWAEQGCHRRVGGACRRRHRLAGRLRGDRSAPLRRHADRHRKGRTLKGFSALTHAWVLPCCNGRDAR